MANTRAYKQAMAQALTPDEAKQVLRDLAYANRDIRVDCQCGKRKTINVIDARTRLDAVKAALDYGFGKPAQQRPEPDAPSSMDELETLTDGQLSALTAV